MLNAFLAALITVQVDSAQSSPPASRQESSARNGSTLLATVTLAKSKISIDGILDEPDWVEAPSIGEIIQREPKQDENATEQTVVKLLYDSQNFYVGVTCYDSEPQKVIGTQMARDADLSVDDRRNAFYFSTEVNTSFQYKFAPHFQASVELRQTFARLKEGNFVARVYILRANYSVSPFLTFFNLVQFDNESRDLGWQSRVRWIIHPGNEVFIVFNQGWLQDEHGGFNFRSAGTRLAGKMQYTFRF